MASDYREPGAYTTETRDQVLRRIVELYRTNPIAKDIVAKIHRLAEKLRARLGDEPVKIMDFCGTHEWTITHFGLRSLMPSNVELVAGPGCPVCITPAYYIDVAIKLALDGITVYTYGDAYKLPGSAHRGSGKPRSLAEARAAGGSIEVVYSVVDAVKRARETGKESVFLAVGFETTAPATASAVARRMAPRNLTFINVHRLTPPIMRHVFEVHKKRIPIRGVIAPGHVSTITGAKAWKFVPEEYGIPTVVAGFEPIDVLLAILEILRQLVAGEAKLVNEYTRAVTWEGNTAAQRAINECCEVVDAAWRGLGFVPKSGLAFRDKYAEYDALRQYGIPELTPERFSYDLPPGCRCAEVTLGLAKPTDCPHFLRGCTPANPYGPCMVSSEGTCAVWARYGGGGLALEVAKEIGLL
ncbi:hydrogenase expression/formation protein HypD [Pyrolobus fumarii 1A]|uniref:Hydrogenase expression/formation protein HypD n=1 Tax=Pyrolobus fumarii (strain DSM 11204 / 1A) TaxID=694429 RepID=G0ED40_PYRF1|nr:hydrogenase formation protein HypD [Pyrolobus fumarii]AEM38599.1 hydrogenase expression/formation protein HypD [Pyrolobus fumarii 1A]